MSMSAVSSGSPTDATPDPGATSQRDSAAPQTVSDAPIYDEVAAELGDPRADR